MQSSAAFDIVRAGWRSGRLAHSYLVVGNPRTEGGTFARRVASMMLCEEDPQHAPCGSCSACRRVESGAHPDVLVIEPEKASRRILVGAIRPDADNPPGSRRFFLEWANQKSFEGGWKIGIMLFADRLNEQAANIILKTLEEPPENTCFLLVTDRPDEMLPTIISRCQRLDLASGRTPPAEPWRSRVASILSEHSPRSVLRTAATASRLAAVFDEIKTLAEEENEAEIRARSSADPDHWSAPSKDDLKAMVKNREKEKRAAVYQAMQDWYRDIVALSAMPPGSQDPPLFFPEFRDALAERAANVSFRVASRLPEFVQEMRSRIEDRNINKYDFVFSHWLAWMP